jgi:DUF4097 and DUF4098 domain-containing protein YvlB
MRPRSAVFLVLLAAPIPLAAQQKVERRFAVSADVSVRITNNAGTTRLIGWDRDSIAVTGALAPGASFYGGGKGAFAKLGVERPDETVPGPGSTLEIRLPRAARVYVRSITAGIEATGLTGELQLVSVSGAIRVDGGEKLLVAESMDGNLDVGGPIEITRITGGRGTVTLRDTRGDVLATTVAGPIIATGARVSRAHLETVSGPVSYEGAVDPKGTLEVVTHAGDATLRLPASIATEFELQTFSGTIETDLFPKGRVQHRPTDGSPWTFATGGGGAQVTVRSFKGAIRVLKQ